MRGDDFTFLSADFAIFCLVVMKPKVFSMSFFLIPVHY